MSIEIEGKLIIPHAHGNSTSSQMVDVLFTWFMSMFSDVIDVHRLQIGNVFEWVCQIGTYCIVTGKH